MVEVRLRDVVPVAWLLSSSLRRPGAGPVRRVLAVVAQPAMWVLVVFAWRASHLERRVALLVFRRGGPAMDRTLVRSMLRALVLYLLLDLAVRVVIGVVATVAGRVPDGWAFVELVLADRVPPALWVLVLSVVALKVVNPRPGVRPPAEARWFLGPAAGPDDEVVREIVGVVHAVVPPGETAFLVAADDSSRDLMTAAGFVPVAPGSRGLVLTVPAARTGTQGAVGTGT